MPPKPKRKLHLYIPRIMADLMWATTKDSTSVHFGFGHRCHKHGKLFDLEHIGTCNALTGCPDIAKYARLIKEGGNIRQWDQEVLADAITPKPKNPICTEEIRVIYNSKFKFNTKAYLLGAFFLQPASLAESLQ